MSKDNKKKAEQLVGRADIRKMLNRLYEKNSRKSYNYKEASAELNLKNATNRGSVYETLKEMCEEGLLEEITSGRYSVKRAVVYLTGVVDLKSSGSAYIISDESPQDIFIRYDHLKHALDGDKVKVLLHARSSNGKPEGEVVEILSRKRNSFVGVLTIHKNYAFLVPDGRQMPYDILIPADKLHKAVDGDKVVVKIVEWGEVQHNPVGEVIEVLGRPGDNDTEMNAIMAEFELPVKFPSTVLNAAEKIPIEIPQEEYKIRRDFRNTTTFTIDPADAKDFDDALSFKRLPDGKMEVGVHIADVSYYVRPGTTLDKEAYARATSVYLVDRTIPMLPEILSNNLCSLRPNEEKLCFSAVFILNDDAEILDHWFGRTIICSNRRFAYEEAQTIIEGGDGDCKDEILTLNTLAQKLRAIRFKRGAIDFDRSEARFDLDENGKPLRVYFKESKEANKLIEEFMLLANREVAERIGKVTESEKARTFVYRIHENPLEEKLKDLNSFIARFGYSIRMTSRKALTTSMNELIQKVKGRPEENLIQTLAVRTMAKAVYSTTNVGHYGLAFDFYTHFTSPIRRYPDVMVHRLLQRYLDGGRSVNKETYEGNCKHSSEMEQLAANAERASIKYKQVEFMSDKLGQDFEGTISGVTAFGFYVELDDSKCEGMVSIGSLEDDRYEFDEKNYAIIGHFHHKIYQLGEKVKVKIAKANLQTRQLDFELADNSNIPTTDIVPTKKKGFWENVDKKGKKKDRKEKGRRKR